MGVTVGVKIPLSVDALAHMDQGRGHTPGQIQQVRSGTSDGADNTGVFQIRENRQHPGDGATPFGDVLEEHIRVPDTVKGLGGADVIDDHSHGPIRDGFFQGHSRERMPQNFRGFGDGNGGFCGRLGFGLRGGFREGLGGFRRESFRRGFFSTAGQKSHTAQAHKQSFHFFVFLSNGICRENPL